MAESPNANVTDPSLWNQVPELVTIEIATWEHTILVPESWGRVNRVANLRRILPHELTNPIYERMALAEALFLRRTEPIPPFQERLARDFEAQQFSSGSETDEPHGFALADEIYQTLQGNLILNDVVPNWDEEIAKALKTNVPQVADGIRHLGSLGLPRGEFSVSYGYRVSVRRIKGDMLSQQTATNGALLMGSFGPAHQPGPIRDLLDLF